MFSSNNLHIFTFRSLFQDPVGNLYISLIIDPIKSVSISMYPFRSFVKTFEVNELSFIKFKLQLV